MDDVCSSGEKNGRKNTRYVKNGGADFGRHPDVGGRPKHSVVDSRMLEQNPSARYVSIVRDGGGHSFVRGTVFVVELFSFSELQ